MRNLHLFKQKKGVTAVLVAIMLVMLFGFAALAIDIGYGMVTRNQLQNAADAAALAATRQLGLFYEDMTFEEQAAYDVSIDDADGNGAIDQLDIIEIARDTARANLGEPFNISDDDVAIGIWASGTLSPTSVSPRAVRVTAGRDGSSNAAISTFFANVFGIATMNVSALATAALTPVDSVPEGGLSLPLGISSCNACGDTIAVSPTASCAGWNTYLDSPATANKLRCLLGWDSPSCGSDPDLLSCASGGTDCFESPGITAGETELIFTGGDLGTQAFGNFSDLFDAMKVLNDGLLDRDEDPETWTVAVAVYQDDSCPFCKSPNGAELIVGFALMTISSVGSSDIQGTLVCDGIIPGTGGGPPFGTGGSIPGLVQ